MKINRSFPIGMILTGWLFFSPVAFSQELSLTDCLVYGMSNNPLLKKSTLDTERSQSRVQEVYAGLYPQVRANASVNDNLRLQTSILPGEIFGQPGQLVPVQFGTQYNVTAGIDATQVIFDAAIFSGVKLANQSVAITELNADLTEEQLIFNIAQAYYAAQVTAAQRDIISVNLLNLDTLVMITKLKYENQVVLKSDYDRVLINQVNLQTEISTLEMNYEKQLRILKYYMGMPIDTAIAISTGVSDPGLLQAEEYSSSNSTSLRLLKMQNELYYSNIQQIRAGYYPSLSLSFRYAYMAQQNDLNIFGANSQWYPMSFLTLNVAVPIFDGFAKAKRVQQVQVDIQKNELEQEDTESYLEMQYQNALNEIKISSSSLAIQKKNIELAQEVYRVATLQYQQGIDRAALSDLINSEIALQNAQSNYMQALVRVKVAQLDLLRATGSIKSILE